MIKIMDFLFRPLVSFADNGPTPPATGEVTSLEQVYAVLNGILNVAYTVFFIVAAIFIVLAAFSFLNAGGDEEKVRNAKQKLFYAVIAIIIALVSYSAATLISSTLANPPSLNIQPSGPGGTGAICTTAADCTYPLICYYAGGRDPTGTCQYPR